MKKIRKPDKGILFIFYIIKWKFTKGSKSKLLTALFDMSDRDLTLRAPFYRRSWVTKWSKIFKKSKECVFLTDEHNLEICLEKRVINHENRAKNRLFFGFPRG